MNVLDQPLPGVFLIETQVFGDDRGSFVETFHRAKMAELGIDFEFVQDNESFSAEVGTVRGLHFQLEPHAQGKLVRVTRGAIVDVAVDIRPDSPTYLRHCAVTLRGADNLLFWVPPGFAHGFCTVEPETVLNYKCTAVYEPTADRSIRWNDPQIGIAWPVAAADAILSAKDAAAPSLDQLESELGP